MADPEALARIMETVSASAGHQEVLDELVHDIKSHEASEINNNGPDAQIEFLLEWGLSADDILSTLCEGL